MKKKIGLLFVFSIILNISIAIGQNTIDNFTLQSVTNNQQFTLHDAQGDYVALHFLLKTECPVCLRHTQDYFSRMDELPNVRQIFIKPDTEEEIKAWAQGLDFSELNKYPIYHDPSAQLAKKLNIPYGYEFHNQTVHYPALILINPEGEEVFRYVGKNNRDRYSFGDLEAKMKKLQE